MDLYEADQELAKRVSKGDRSAAEHLVAEHYLPVLRVLTLLARDEDCARDLAQETFIRARLKVASYRGNSPIRLWLQAIAYREFLKKKRRRRPDESLEVGLEGHASTVGLSVEALDLWDAIGQLSEPLRAAFVLREVIGWSTAETAKILAVPLGTVTARLSRARQKLRDSLCEGDWSPDSNEAVTNGI